MTMIINTGLGNIGLSIDTQNLKLKMFLDSLKDKIEIYGLDEIINVLDKTDTVKGLIAKVTELEALVEAKDNEIDELSDPDDFNVQCNATINTGLGEINYESPNNLLLVEIMDNLDAAINKTTPMNVNSILSSI